MNSYITCPSNFCLIKNDVLPYCKSPNGSKLQRKKAMIDETRAILGKVREQEDDDNEACFNTKPKVYKSALDVYLQLNFSIESESCNSSMVQPLLQQLRAPKAPVRGVALCVAPLFLLSLSGSPHLLSLPHFTFTGYLPGKINSPTN